MADPLPPLRCANNQPHAAHVIKDRDAPWECDGVPSPKFGTADNPRVPGPFPISPNQALGWVDAFYVDSFIDVQALTDPKFAPRRKATNGPFPTYQQAAEYVPQHRPEATHFTVNKMVVKGDLVKWYNPAVIELATEEIG